MKHTLYPYFAFDIPDLRNQVAHKGIVENVDIELLAYELVLDLNCIVGLVEKESTDKFKSILIINDKLNSIDLEGDERRKDYSKAVAECLFVEVLRENAMPSEFFWELLTDPDNYEEEMDYYVPEDAGDNDVSLKDIVCAISEFIRKDIFWTVVLEACGKITTIDRKNPYDLGAFVEKLKNLYISRLDGEAKELCCQINAKLQTIMGAQ